MCYTAEETGLITGIIQSYFAPQSVSEQIRRRYWETHQHLQQEQIDHLDLLNIRAALAFVAPVFQGSRQTEKDIWSVIAKTDAFLSAAV